MCYNLSNKTQKRKDFLCQNLNVMTKNLNNLSLISIQTGKTQTELCKDYGVSHTALARWIKQYSQVKLDDDTVMTAKQIKELQKRNAQLEEENLILKKASAIFMQNSK